MAVRAADPALAYGGARPHRPTRTSHREMLEGIAFVLSTGSGWAKLLTEFRLRLGLDLLAADARVD